MDSGASRHTCNDRAFFKELHESAQPDIKVGNGVALQVVGEGNVALFNASGACIQLTNVLYVPSMVVNLVSVYCLAQQGVRTLFDGQAAYLTMGHDHDLIDIARAMPPGLYVLTACLPKSPLPASQLDPILLVANQGSATLHTWHRRLGHLNFRGVQALPSVTQDMHVTPDNNECTHSEVCPACTLGKLRAAPYPGQSNTVWERPMQVVHMDLLTMPVLDLHGMRYAATFVDGYSSYSEVVLLRSKAATEVLQAVEAVINVWARTHSAPLHFHVDGGGEYQNQLLQDWCRTRGIVFVGGAPYAHQQNGKAERFNLTLANKTRAVMEDACLPSEAWGEVLLACNYLSNLAVPQGQHLTAYQLFWRVAPTVQHLRVIGCLAYVLVPDTPARKKLDARAVPAVFVGYNMHCKAYRFLFRDRSGRMQVLVRRDAVFDEHRCGWPLLSQDPHAIQKLLLTDWQHADDVRRQLIGPDRAPAPDGTTDPPAPPAPPPPLPIVPGSLQLDPLHDLPSYTQDAAPGDGDVARDGTVVASEHTTAASPSAVAEHVVPDGDGNVQHTNSAVACDGTPPAPGNEHTVQEGGGASGSHTPTPAPLSTAPARRVAPAERRQLPARNRQPVQGVHNKLWHSALLAVNAVTPPQTSVDDAMIQSALRDALPEVAAALLAHLLPPDASDERTHTTADDEDDKPSVRKALRGKYAVEWMQAILRELFQLQQHGTWVVGPIPPGVRPTPCMWVLVRKRDADGRIEKYKARLVFRGDLQDEQEFDDTFAPTGRMDAVRMFFALVCIHDLDWEQMDVSNAFLNGVLANPVHMQFPPYVEQVIPEYGHGTCLVLRKTIYGLRQACREWRMVLDTALQSERIQLTPMDKDPTIYIKHADKGFAMMKVWTDDMLIAGKGMPIVQDICNEVEQCWNTHHLGEPKQFVGIKIDRDRAAGTLTISQPKLIAHILQITHMDQANPAQTPMDPGTRLDEPGEYNPSFTLHGCTYQQLVGKLNYLVQCTRPDLAFAVSQLARHQSRPGKKCWDALKRVLRYLSGTRDLGITYNRNTPSDLTVYTDADFANRPDRRSVGAYVAMMAGGAVAWQSKLQSTIATSTAHSEHIAAFESVRQTTYMRDLLTQMSFLSEGAPPTPLLCDNDASISVSKLEGVTNRNKHWEVKLFYVRQQQSAGVVSISHVPSQDNLADALTKALPAPQLRSLMHRMGVRRRV